MSKLIVGVLNLCRKSLQHTVDKTTKQCEACVAKREAVDTEHDRELERAWDAYLERVEAADVKRRAAMATLDSKNQAAYNKQLEAQKYLTKLS